MKRYIGNKGWGENLSFGNYKTNPGKRHVLSLLIDDGVLDRNHRRNIYDTRFTDVGIAHGLHTVYGEMLTMDFGIQL